MLFDFSSFHTLYYETKSMLTYKGGGTSVNDDANLSWLWTCFGTIRKAGKEFECRTKAPLMAPYTQFFFYITSIGLL